MDSSARPNILWVSVEDINPLLGCYGDTYAITPHLDALAERSVRYGNAHSMAPVCSASRSSIITGVAACSLGTHHHRSAARMPEQVRLMPAYLREAGYFTTNNVKTDYNLAGTGGPGTAVGPEEADEARRTVGLMDDAFSEWSRAAHWRHRRAGQPFFAVFNYEDCHSSVTWDSPDAPGRIVERERFDLLASDEFHDPDEAPVPPYHPDVPEFRAAWARYYDAVTQIDHRVAAHLEALEDAGVAEDTIVAFWADHGTGMLRAKHWLWEQGDHVPLMIYYPPRWQHLAPELPGSVVESPVTTLDLAASTLVMAGLPVPSHMHSRPTLVAASSRAAATRSGRSFVISGRDRLDTRFEFIRAVRGSRFRYQRNFYPHRPYFPYENSIYWSSYVGVWDGLARAGKLVGAQRQIAAKTKPFEELYDGAGDRHFVEDLARNPEHKQVLDEMRGQLYDWMVEHRDLGVFDEPELYERAGDGPLWTVGQRATNYERILETADLSRQGRELAAEMVARAGDDDSAVRFWAITGLVILGARDEASIATLLTAVGDDAVSVRIAAADGLLRLDRHEAGLPALIAGLEHPIAAARGRAANVLDSQPPASAERLRPALEPLQRALDRLGDTSLDAVQYRNPMLRAVAVIEGSDRYYRWD